MDYRERMAEIRGKIQRAEQVIAASEQQINQMVASINAFKGQLELLNELAIEEEKNGEEPLATD